MRYFQYDGEIPSIEVLRKKGMKLSAAMNRNRRRAGLLGALGTVVFWVLFLVLGGAQIFLINWIMPGEEGIVWVIVDFVGKGIKLHCPLCHIQQGCTNFMGQATKY